MVHGHPDGPEVDEHPGPDLTLETVDLDAVGRFSRGMQIRTIRCGPFARTDGLRVDEPLASCPAAVARSIVAETLAGVLGDRGVLFAIPKDRAVGSSRSRTSFPAPPA